jgi:hypothetical protein
MKKSDIILRVVILKVLCLLLTTQSHTNCEEKLLTSLKKWLLTLFNQWMVLVLNTALLVQYLVTIPFLMKVLISSLQSKLEQYKNDFVDVKIKNTLFSYN